MKKLMILGGSRYAIPVIKAAHELGLYVITCDYLPNNIAHQYSDEYCNVSIIDQEATLAAAEHLGINGITSFACDPGVVTAAFVAEKMDLPSIGSYESVCILQNKGKFRQFLTENGFNVPMAKSYYRLEDALKDIDLFHWPVIVKPTDSAGSKGVHRVNYPTELKKNIEHAIAFSHSNEFIIEDFIPQKGFSSDSDCFSVDGKMKFVSFSSQYFDFEAGNPYTPAAFSWPSSISEDHQKELTSEIQRLIKLLNLGTSIYNIETRESYNDKAYIMECSPRGGGNRLAECLEYATGVKLVENAVRAAMGMPIEEIAQKPYNGYWAEIILHSNCQGIYKNIWVDHAVKDKIVEIDEWRKPGEKISGFTAANESLGTIIFKFDKHKEMEHVMNNIPEYVRVMTQ